jgi:hypothetical protein
MTAPDHEEPVPPKEVSEFLHCEISTALDNAKKRYPDLEKFVASYDVTLRKEQNLAAGVGALSWIIPGSAARSYSLGASLGVSDKGTSITTFSGEVGLDSTPPEWCGTSAPQTFRGHLGIDDWIDQMVSDKLPPQGFGRTYEFDLSYDANLRPGFAIVNLSGAAGVGGTRLSRNTLLLRFTKQVKQKPREVVIVGPDGKTQKGIVAGPEAVEADQKIQQIQLLDILNRR